MRRIGAAGIIIGAIAAIITAYQVYLSTTFHVVGTTPNTSQVGTVSAYIRIDFNRPLSSNSLSVSSNPKVISSYKVDDQSLLINLDTPMELNQQYTITIGSIYDTGGDRLLNKTVVFVPQDLSTQQIIKNQGLAGLAQPAPAPRSGKDIVFNGVGALTDVGISSDQLTKIEQWFFIFSPSAKMISIDQGSVQQAPRDPSADGFSINFAVTVDSTHYTGTATYTDSSNISLSLYNVGHTQVFDSTKQTKFE